MGVIGHAASSLGRGLVAGLVGTAVMTVSSTLEARIRGRGDSDAPAQALATLLAVREYDDGGARATRAAHWGYGTALGAARGLLGATGLSTNAADVAFHATVLAAEQTMLPVLGIAPPATRWPGREIASDLAHHTAYSLATNGAYRLLSR